MNVVACKCICLAGVQEFYSYLILTKWLNMFCLGKKSIYSVLLKHFTSHGLNACKGGMASLAVNNESYLILVRFIVLSAIYSHTVRMKHCFSRYSIPQTRLILYSKEIVKLLPFKDMILKQTWSAPMFSQLWLYQQFDFFSKIQFVIKLGNKPIHV